MKQLLPTLATLASIFAFASTVAAAPAKESEKRSFRINPASVHDGYAIAWGFQGQKVDFENLDGLNDDQLATLFAKRGASVKNYVVQLETNRILATLDGRGKTLTASRIDGRLGSSQFSADFSLSTVPVYAANLPHGQKLLLVMQEMANVTTVRQMLVIQESDSKPAKVISKSLAFNRLFDDAFTAALPADQLSTFRRTNIFKLSLKPASDNPFEAIEFTVEASDSRTETSLSRSGTLQISFDATARPTDAAGTPTMKLQLNP